MKLLKSLFNPDKNIMIMKAYHKSNKIMLPLLIPSIFLDNENSYKQYFDFANLNILGFHSYVSFSSIITDYHKKIPFINENIIRAVNFKTHGFLFVFFSYNLFNYYNNYNNDLDKVNILKKYDTISFQIYD